MGFLDKAKELLDEHDDMVDKTLGQVGEAAKGRFAGQDGLIDGLVSKAKAMTGDGDSTAPPPPAPADSPPAAPPTADAEPEPNPA
ncbi:MAG: hypothetical protein QOG76_1203 [Pseudonocardiales bacterium]|jgi:hypothetical protein|nr:hypothetical protein [Pseudonocardiales bacterium]